MNHDKKTAVVIGASPKPERYSNKAVAELIEHGYKVIPINPGGMVIHDFPAVKKLSDVKEKVDVITVYVNPKISSTLEKDIIALAPRLIIFNPGTENPDLEAALENAEIRTLHACTLVLLHTKQFEAHLNARD